jgi:DNA-binding NtrC family response regulator
MTHLDAVIDRPDTMPAPPRSTAAAFRVLVADDQSDVVAALRLLLGSQDIAVLAAASPMEALSIASHQPIDAALVDLNFEKGRTSGDQGLDLVSGLVNAHPTLPVIVMTAWSSGTLVMDALQRGARDFVEKPWNDSRLTALVRSHAQLGRALRRVGELETEVHELRSQTGTPASSGSTLPNMRLLEVEGFLVRRAMEHHQGNVSRAARTLGLSRSALYRRLERHKL